jgi:hypothetical protein
MKNKIVMLTFLVTVILFLNSCDYYVNTNIQSNNSNFSKTVNGTYYIKIEGNYYNPDPSYGSPWIALSSYGSRGSDAYYGMVGLRPSQVVKLTISVYSFDNGNDSDGEHIHVYNYITNKWDYWGASDKSEKWHSFYVSGSEIYNYISTDGTVMIWIESGWLDHTHLKYVSITEQKKI